MAGNSTVSSRASCGRYMPTNSAMGPREIRGLGISRHRGNPTVHWASLIGQAAAGLMLLPQHLHQSTSLPAFSNVLI